MTTYHLCNARNGPRRCGLKRGHRGDHSDPAGTWPRRPRNSSPPEAAELASRVLSELAAGRTPTEIAATVGVSRQRVGQIAKASAVRPVRDRDLLSRLRELAADAGESPSDWLEDAERARHSVEAIVARINLAIECGYSVDANPLVGEVLALAIGPSDPALAAQVRAATVCVHGHALGFCCPGGGS